MKFTQLPYSRPDIASFEKQFNELLQRMTLANSAEEQKTVLEEIYKLRRKMETAMTIVSVRNSIDTSDKFYEAEQEFFDHYEPKYKDLIMSYYRMLIQSKFRNELEIKLGKQLFMIAEMAVKTFSPVIIENLQKENQLCTEYTKLLASAKIEFQGQKYNLSGLGPFKLSPDRNIRKEANEKYDNFFEQNAKQLDEIFDELVNLRHNMALQLGFKNFVELGYARMQRVDYNTEMVAKFRQNVLKMIVPLVTKMKQRQQKRLSLPTLMYYDEGLDFNSGNAKPKGNPKWIVANGTKMYNELSPETGEFFRFMVESELMDLVNKPNKAGGGYMTYLSEYKAPFIFSNFNGTSHDVDVLTHEAGHAFQAYRSRNIEIDEYLSPTYEACEIHSMSMEFLTYPWMQLFFEEMTDKYKFAHVTHALMFIPYGVAVDEFQHFIYENPTVTPAERNRMWRTIEKKYLPHRRYEGSSYMENGGFWQRQMHIYRSPFYYIDYTLAQLCAFQFWKKSTEDRSAALKDYIRLCDAGGSQSFLALVKLAGLKSPFESATIKEIVVEVEEWLNGINDIALN